MAEKAMNSRMLLHRCLLHLRSLLNRRHRIHGDFGGCGVHDRLLGFRLHRGLHGRDGRPLRSANLSDSIAIDVEGALELMLHDVVRLREMTGAFGNRGIKGASVTGALRRFLGVAGLLSLFLSAGIPIRHACLRCALLLRGGLHLLGIRVARDVRFIQLAVELRGGERQIWLADDVEHLRRVRQLRQALSPALDERRAAEDAERHVRADLRAQFAQSIHRQRVVAMAVQRPQNGCCVCAAAAEPRAAGDPLCDANLQSVGTATEIVIKYLRRAPRQIVLILRNIFAVAEELPFPALIQNDLHVVADGDRLHHGAEVMIAVLAAAQNVQRQIDFCECTLGEFCHLIFLPSR